MPSQVTGVAVTSRGTTYDVQVGPNGFQGLATADLFDRDQFDADHLFDNIRLKKLIGNYGDVASKEFKDAISKSGGIKSKGANYYHLGVTTNPDGSYTVAFGFAEGAAPNLTITCSRAALEDDTHDIGVVLKNIGSFLRTASFNDLTTPAPNGLYAGKTAIQAVAEQTWWF